MLRNFSGILFPVFFKIWRFYLGFGCLFGPMAIDMDTFGSSTEGSPTVVPPVVTFPKSVDADETMGHLVARKIREYCEGKLIDDHD